MDDQMNRKTIISKSKTFEWFWYSSNYRWLKIWCTM